MLCPTYLPFSIILLKKIILLCINHLLNAPSANKIYHVGTLIYQVCRYLKVSVILTIGGSTLVYIIGKRSQSNNFCAFKRLLNLGTYYEMLQITSQVLLFEDF